MRLTSKLLVAAKPKQLSSKIQELVPILEAQKGNIDFKEALAKMGYKGVLKQECFTFFMAVEPDEELIEEMRLDDPEYEPDPPYVNPVKEVTKIHSKALAMPGTFFIWAPIKVDGYDTHSIYFYVCSLKEAPEGNWPNNMPENFDAYDGDGEVGCGNKQDMLEELEYLLGEAGSEDVDVLELDDNAILERHKLKTKKR